MGTFAIEHIGLPTHFICQPILDEPTNKRKFKASCGTILIFSVTNKLKIKSMTRDEWNCKGCDSCRELAQKARALIVGA